jgi:hypothetical protein
MKKSLVLLFFWVQISASAQISVPFTSDEWRFVTNDYVLEEFLGRPSVLLKNNRAFLPKAEFENGIIEYDVAFPQQRAFIAVMFRMADDANGEEFYLRAHQSGNPDANQYTPLFSGLSAWQLYYGEGYGVPIKYTFDTWIHVKLVVSGKYMEVYVNDMENPVLFAALKREAKKGYLGVYNFRGESHFANFTYTPLDQVALKGSPKAELTPAKGTILQWEVSEPFAEKDLDPLMSVKNFNPGHDWKKASTEPTGVLNLASVIPWSSEKNCVFARVIVNADRDEVKKFIYGFSDRARIYLNGDLVYAGEDNYLSRDYRFLGTMGYYDALYLKLKKGRNEIRVAVSEDFGGWGIMGKLQGSDELTTKK